MREAHLGAIGAIGLRPALIFIMTFGRTYQSNNEVDIIV